MPGGAFGASFEGERGEVFSRAIVGQHLLIVHLDMCAKSRKWTITGKLLRDIEFDSRPRIESYTW
jgi:hypothetical protein